MRLNKTLKLSIYHQDIVKGFLLKISASGRRIQDGQAHEFLGIYQENRSTSQRHAIFAFLHRIQHVKLDRQISVRIVYYREWEDISLDH